MGLNIPSRSAEQVQDLKDGITVNALYPYSFRINRTFTAGNFPNSDGAIGSFVQFIWTPQISLGIVIAEATSIQTNSAGYASAVQVSLSSAMTLADAGSLTMPTDEANIIFCAVFTLNAISLFEHRYTPEDYYIVAGTPVYISFWVAAAAIGNAGNVISNLILHTIPLGLGT